MQVVTGPPAKLKGVDEDEAFNNGISLGGGGGGGRRRWWWAMVVMASGETETERLIISTTGTLGAHSTLGLHLLAIVPIVVQQQVVVV